MVGRYEREEEKLYGIGMPLLIVANLEGGRMTSKHSQGRQIRQACEAITSIMHKRYGICKTSLVMKPNMNSF